MHFIVTGGAGFIGSHITEQLLMEGHKVTLVDNLSTGHLKNFPKHPDVQFIQKDVSECQPEDFTQPIDGIAHLAATASVQNSWLYPLKAHHNNLSDTVTVVLMCQVLNIPRLVFASSSAVYGNTSLLPVLEEQEKRPISPYGLQKLASEQYIHLWCQQLKLSAVCLRMFNVFGPRQDPHSSYSGVISIFTKAMQQNLPITVYGDGKQTRDFVYVKDVAIAFTKALTAPLPTGSCTSCNVGMGKQTSLLHLVNILRSFFSEWNAGIHFASSRVGDIKHSRADTSKISSLLDFQPQWSVEEGLRLLVESLALE